jgi:hypothetical protein
MNPVSTFYIFLLTFSFSLVNAQKMNKKMPMDGVLLQTNKAHLLADVKNLDTISDDQFLERIQYDYTKNCLKYKDSIAITENDGYRINLFCVAVKNGWLPRDEAAEAVLKYLQEYQNAATAQGIFPRSFSRRTGQQIKGLVYGNFGQPYDVVGTAFFAASIQFVVSPFFDADNQVESEIRTLCKKICDRIDWDFAYKEDRKCFTWFKNGNNGEQFDGKELYGEMDETFFIQLLVLSAKKWKHGKDAYQNYVSNIFVDAQYGYRYFSTKEYNYKTSEQFTGIKVNNSKALSLKDYPTAKLGYLVQSHIWFDLQGYRDSICEVNNMDYFEGTQNAIKAQIKYAQINLAKNHLYGDVWGFYDTYSPLSNKWMVTGLPMEGDTDEGTIAISAVMSAVVFEPQAAIKCLRTLYHEYKDKGIYGESGFVMSVNTNTGKMAKQPDTFFEPICVLSIENYRSGLIWKLAKKSPEYHESLNKSGLKKVSFNK